jgi:hypothetical protein
MVELSILCNQLSGAAVASSKVRMANLRGDSAGRSYRSMVTSVSSPPTESWRAWPALPAWCSESPQCLLDTHNEGSPTHRKEVDGAHNARGANRSALRRLGVRVLGCRPWPQARQFRRQALQPLRIVPDWKRRAGSARGEAGFAPSARDRRSDSAASVLPSRSQG